MTVRLTQLSLQQKGNLIPKERTGDESAVDASHQRWGDRLPFLRGESWKGTDPAMAADLFRAVAADLIAEHGPLASVKACQLVASYVGTMDPPTATIDASWPAATASLRVSISFETPAAQSQEPITGQAVSDEELSVEQLKDAVAEELMAGRTVPSFVLDPMTMVPEDRLLALAIDLEERFPESAQTVLFAGAMMLLIWQSCETMHATDLAVTIQGLYVNNELIMPGREAKIKAVARLMDASPSSPSQEPPVTFHARKPRVS